MFFTLILSRKRLENIDIQRTHTYLYLIHIFDQDCIGLLVYLDNCNLLFSCQKNIHQETLATENDANTFHQPRGAPRTTASGQSGGNWKRWTTCARLRQEGDEIVKNEVVLYHYRYDVRKNYSRNYVHHATGEHSNSFRIDLSGFLLQYLKIHWWDFLFIPFFSKL